MSGHCHTKSSPVPLLAPLLGGMGVGWVRGGLEVLQNNAFVDPNTQLLNL